MAFHASVSPPDGPPIWLSADELPALQKEVVGLIEKHGRVFARLIVDGKPCRVSKAIQVFYMENPEAGKPPIPLALSEVPVFDEQGEVEFLVQKPRDEQYP